jgi:hypothetical protein
MHFRRVGLETWSLYPLSLPLPTARVPTSPTVHFEVECVELLTKGRKIEARAGQQAGCSRITLEGTKPYSYVLLYISQKNKESYRN